MTVLKKEENRGIGTLNRDSKIDICPLIGRLHNNDELPSSSPNFLFLSFFVYFIKVKAYFTSLIILLWLM